MAAERRLRQTDPTAAPLSDSKSLYHTLLEALFVDIARPRHWHAACFYQPTGTFLMPTSVLWHGSQTEALELLQALSRNCSCVVTAEGVRLSTCAPHQMLSSDQRAIDGLLFARRISSRLRSEEFSPHLAESVT